jgi:hypothetical protein
MTNEETHAAANVAEQGTTVTPEKVSSKKGASQKKGAPKRRKDASSGKTRVAAAKKQAKDNKKAVKSGRAKEASTPRAESKGAKILELIGRPRGAMLAEIMRSVAWQAHSVRGYLSAAAKKHRIKIESTKNDAGERTYTIAK